MVHLIFFLGIVAFTLGISSLTVVGLLYKRHRNQLLLHYLILFGAVTLLYFTEIVGFFAHLVEDSGTPARLVVDQVTTSFFYLLCGIIVYCFPVLIMKVVGKSHLHLRRLLLPVAGIFPVGLIVYFTIGLDLSLLADTAFFTTLVFGLVVLNVKVSRIRILDLRSFSRRLLTIFFVFTPLFLVQSYGFSLLRRLPPWLESIPHFFIVFFFCWSILNITYAARSFFKPLESDSFEVPQSFVQEFGLTERETVILGAVVRGAANKQIAYELSISEKTVKNHNYNAFQKVGVHSRMELVRVMEAFKE